MAVTIDSNFPGGAVENVRFINENEIVFEAPLDGSPRSLWFYFRIRGAGGKTITLRQDNMERVLGVVESRTYAMVRPVVREGIDGEWERIPGNHIYFSDSPLYFCFTITPDSDETYVAFSYPYLYGDLEGFIKKYDSPCIKKVVLGKSGEARDFPMLLLEDTEANNEKKLIVCEARQHAGEVSGSYVLEGFMDAFLSDTDFGRSIRDKALLAVFPLADIDGVEEGRYGKDRPPVDFNRDWSYYPKHPEIKLMQDAIGGLASRHEFVLFTDLHSPQPGGNSYVIPARLSSIGEEKWNGLWAFAYELEKNLQDVCGFRVMDLDSEYLNWGGANYKFNAVQYIASKYSAASVTLETSYHVDRDGKTLGPEEWREMGRRLLNAAANSYVFGNGICSQDLNFQVSSVERIWKYWELVNIPENAHINEDGECISIESTGGVGQVWLTYRPMFSKDDNSRGSKKIIFDSLLKQKSQVEIMLYYYKDGVVVKATKPSCVYMEHGRFEYEMDTHIPGDIDDFKASVRIMGLNGKISIRIE